MISRPIAPPPVAPPSAPARPMPGTGTRLTFSTALGYSYSAAPSGGATFRHPFRPALGVNAVSLSRGLVDAFEPVIGKAKISTGAKLALDPKVANENGESWVCLEVVPNAEGVLDEKSRVEIVHLGKGIRSLDPALGRIALVLVLWHAGRAFQTHDIVDFNLRYERVIPAIGPVRHLFL